MASKLKREAIEWIVLISIGGILYVTGLHTEVIGRLQQLIVSTGIISPSLADGKEAADFSFELTSTDGTSVSFESFKGEVVFLNFWATWCPPCIAEMPDIQRLYDQQKENVQFVMISVDKEPEKAKAFIDRKEYTFPVFFLNGSLPKGYDIHSIPTTYVLDKEGQIQVENHGMAKYNSTAFNKLLHQLSEAE